MIVSRAEAKPATAAILTVEEVCALWGVDFFVGEKRARGINKDEAASVLCFGVAAILQMLSWMVAADARAPRSCIVLSEVGWGEGRVIFTVPPTPPVPPD